MEFDLEGNSVDGSTLRPYGERFIHGAILEARPDVHSVVHNHSLSVIPFGVTGTALQPIIHTGAAIGRDIPIWDINDAFGDTDCWCAIWITAAIWRIVLDRQRLS